METRLRTLVRSVSWRISGVLLAVALTWWYTRDLTLSVELGIAYNVIRLATHYFHDRLWARVDWGMIHNKGTPRENRTLARGETVGDPESPELVGVRPVAASAKEADP